MLILNKTFIMLILAGISISTSSQLNAQLTDESEAQASGIKVSHQLGLTASALSGTGLNYQLQVGIVGLEATGYIFHTETDDRTETDYSYGLELQLALMRGEMYRFYGLAGMHLVAEDYSWRQPLFNGEFETMEAYRETVTSGLGLGIELVFWDHLSTNFDFGLAYSNSQGGADKELGPAAAIGIGFRF